jgi:hypothetical protein
LEAFRRLGFNLAELNPVTEDFVRQRIMERERKKQVPKVLVDLRMQHYKDKRDLKIK